MKYLKLFEELGDVSILHDIREILLDFTDIGNEVDVDWVDSKYKDEVVIVLKNKGANLEVDTLIRLFNYMKDLQFTCEYIFCQYPVNMNQFEASDKIYITQQGKDFNFDSDSTTKNGFDQVNSWHVLELVFHKMRLK